MMRFEKVVAAIACVFVSSLMLSVRANAATECSLGGTCRIEKNSQVYFPVTPKSGLYYECRIAADKNTICYRFASGQDFILDNISSNVTFCSRSGNIGLVGHFTGPSGQLIVQNISYDGYGDNASVTCNAVN